MDRETNEFIEKDVSSREKREATPKRGSLE